MRACAARRRHEALHPPIAVDLPEAFKLRCEARALLWAACEIDLHEAVDVLQADAERDGLVELIGQDAVQAIMASAFQSFRGAAAMNAPVCDICGGSPCTNRTFCHVCRKADRMAAKHRPQHGLPPNWDTMSVGALWEALNDRRRWPTPQSTIEAVMHCVRARGAEALKEPATLERLLQCDPKAKAEINRRIAALKGGASAAA